MAERMVRSMQVGRFHFIRREDTRPATNKGVWVKQDATTHLEPTEDAKIRLLRSDREYLISFEGEGGGGCLGGVEPLKDCPGYILIDPQNVAR